MAANLDRDVDEGASTEHRSRRERLEELDPIGTRMKDYEGQLQTYIDATLPHIIRLDGHGFSKFTKRFKKPFDERFSRAMIDTTRDLMGEFNAPTGYTHSDEITLIYPPVNLDNGSTLNYNGKVMKTVSLLAGYCSVRFNYHMQKYFADEEDSTANQSCAYFDARAFNVPTPQEVCNNIMWRSVHDCKRNSISMLAHATFGPKRIVGLSTNELLEALRADGVEWESMPAPFRFGTIIKKKLIEVDAVNPKTGEAVKAVRSTLVERSENFAGFSAAKVEMLLAKYWPEDWPPAPEGGERSNEGSAVAQSEQPVEPAKKDVVMTPA